MATATRTNLVGVDTSIVPKDMWVGSYFWYSIPKENIPLSRLRRAFREAGLDESILPDERRPEHVTMEACKSVERVTTNGHREEIHSAQVMRDEKFLIMQITRHVQDKQHRVIEHPKALRVLYSFEHKTLEFEPLDGATHADVQFLEDAIQEHFDKNSARMSGHNFRTILRHYVEAAGAENMRGQSGGVYFLATENRLSDSTNTKGEYLNKLRQHHGPVIDGDVFIGAVKHALELIYGRAPEWHRIPCINDEEQREFLKRKFLENCGDDLKAYRDECLNLVREKQEGDRERPFRYDLRTRLIEQRKDIDLRRQKFASILGETLEELQRDMTLADKALAKFLTEAPAA